MCTINVPSTKILSLCCCHILSLNPQWYPAAMSLYTHNWLPLATIPWHACLQALFVNTTSPPTLTTNNITPSPSCHVCTLKPSSMDKDKDVLLLLPGLPSALTVLHQQYLATTATHTQQATTSHHCTTIHAQQTSSCGHVTMHAWPAPPHARWALSCCYISLHTCGSPHSSPPCHLWLMISCCVLLYHHCPPIVLHSESLSCLMKPLFYLYLV